MINNNSKYNSIRKSKDLSSVEEQEQQQYAHQQQQQEQQLQEIIIISSDDEEERIVMETLDSSDDEERVTECYRNKRGRDDRYYEGDDENEYRGASKRTRYV